MENIFDHIRAAVLADRSQLWKDLSMPFYGYNCTTLKDKVNEDLLAFIK